VSTAAARPVGSARLMDINVMVAEALQTAWLFAPDTDASNAGQGTAWSPLQPEGRRSEREDQRLMS